MYHSQVSLQVSLWVREKRKQQNNTIDITTRIHCIASVQRRKRNINGNNTSANEKYRHENHCGHDINQSTWYHIVNNLVPCKMKVNRKLKDEKQNETRAIPPNETDESTHCFRTKLNRENKIGERSMYRNNKVAAKAKIISRRADRINLNNLYGLTQHPDKRTKKLAGARRVAPEFLRLDS